MREGDVLIKCEFLGPEVEPESVEDVLCNILNGSISWTIKV